MTMANLPDLNVQNALEERGVDSIRALFINSVGSGENSDFRVKAGITCPRSEVEAWPQHKVQKEEARTGTVIRWTKIGAIAAIIGALSATVAAIEGFK